MRVKSIPAFWKLAEEHLDRLGSSGAFYFFIHPQEGERERLKHLFLEHPLMSKITEVKSFEKVDALFSELEWLPLFSERTLFILEGTPKLKKEHLEHLSKKERAFKGALLFLLAEFPSPALFSSIDQKALCLDLSEEKTWEKKKRIEEQIGEEIRKKKLFFKTEALSIFFDALSPDYLGWREEVEKLSLFKGTSPVTLQDLEALFAPIQEVPFLQGKAQQFLKSGVFEHDATFEDPQRWLQWVGTLRSSIEMGIGFFTWGAPQKGRYSAEFYETITKGWSMNTLQKAWLELFEFERRLKLFQASPSLLWQRTLAKIDFLRFAP